MVLMAMVPYDDGGWYGEGSFALGPWLALVARWCWWSEDGAAVGMMAEDGEGYGIGGLARKLPARRDSFRMQCFTAWGFGTFGE